VFLPNLDEARALTRKDDPAEALAALSGHFPVVALKCGPGGAWLAMDGKVFRRAAPRVEVVDTTGAGDAFNAGFLHAWLDKADGEHCLAAAIEAGTRSVQAAGGTGSIRAGAPA